ncbi:MAG: patatin-like phospholipase family protein [Alphaproteobacteria bacterium]
MQTKKPLIVLFNHGGGMRGLVPAHIMARIEEATGLRMAEMVDVFAGPSTGAILNAGLNVPHDQDLKRPKYRARHMVRFYEREGLRIFPPDRFRDFRGFIHDFNNRTMKISKLNSLFRHGHYDPQHLSYCLKQLYGNTKLHESLKSLVIPVYNIDGEQLEIAEEAGEDDASPVRTNNNFIDRGGHAVWLKNMKMRRNHRKTPDVSLHSAIMGSTAAPSYFPCHHFEVKDRHSNEYRHITGIDGSMFDNACISFHGAIRQHIEADQPVIMIVLGTGFTLRSINKDQWDSYGGLGVVDPVNDLPLINILFHAPESALMESFTQELGSNLHVFNKSLINDIGHPDVPSTAIDDASPDNLKKMGDFASRIIEENQKSFDRVCEVLVRNRDASIHGEEAMKKGFFDIFK